MTLGTHLNNMKMPPPYVPWNFSDEHVSNPTVSRPALRCPKVRTVLYLDPPRVVELLPLPQETPLPMQGLKNMQGLILKFQRNLIVLRYVHTLNGSNSFCNIYAHQSHLRHSFCLQGSCDNEKSWLRIQAMLSWIWLMENRTLKSKDCKRQ